MVTETVFDMKFSMNLLNEFVTSKKLNAAFFFFIFYKTISIIVV